MADTTDNEEPVGKENPTPGETPGGNNEEKPLALDYMFYGCRKLDAPIMSFQDVAPFVGSMDYAFYGAGTDGTTTFDNQKMKFEKLVSCTDCFRESGFGYRHSYFQFYGHTATEGGETRKVTSLKDFFRGNPWLASEAPVVILSKNDGQIDDIMWKLGGINTNTGLPNDDAFCGGGNANNIYTEDAGIADFSGLYADTSIQSADIRGISYCIPKDAKVKNGGKDIPFDYSSMFDNCTELAEIKGSIPVNGVSYSKFLNNCGKMLVDISKSLLHHDENSFKLAYKKDNTGKLVLSSYSPSSISYMFNGISRLYSTNDDFDLAVLVKNTKETAGLANQANMTEVRAAFESAFPVSVIAMDGPVAGVTELSYNDSGISEKFGVMRYCSAALDGTAAGRNTVKKQIGLGTDIMETLFPNGFVRFGGMLQTSRHMIFIPYYPVRNKSGQTIELRPWTSRSERSLRPEGASPDRNVSACFKGHGSWSAARYNPYLVFSATTRNCNNHRAVFSTVPASVLYGALVYTLDGKYVGRRYVGTYAESIDISAHHYKGCHGTWSRHFRTDHPVTVYSGTMTKSIPPVGSAINADGSVDSRNAVASSWYASALKV